MSGIISDNTDRESGLIKTGATTYDDDKLQSNIALLGFKIAVNGSLAKYNLQDQIIDEYEDATGIDAGNSTNELLSSGVYAGGTTSTPSVTEDADDTGTDGDYSWYKWTDTASTGSYNTDTTQDHEYLIVGGGGSGGYNNGGGGGAGGVITATGLSLTGGNEYTVTIGAGGAGVSSGNLGNEGNDSILSGTGITTLTGGGGGGGVGEVGSADDGRATNGSGGGGGYNNTTPGAGDGTGGDGGQQSTSSPGYGAGGGGGASQDGAAGTNTTGGDGGDGVANDIIETGTDVYYGGGGGGKVHSGNTAGSGGNGGGGAGSVGSAVGVAGTANTGGGGGGTNDGTTSGAGGSGVVILRRLTNLITYNDLTLQSTDTTAMAEPDYADMVILMENNAGTATLDTDIKGWISKDSGSTFTQGTLVDEGTWGTNKKIYAFHDATVTSGTDMRYKITTHNQGASKVTKIHATSLGWKA